MQDHEELREALASSQQRLAAQDVRLRELELVLSGLQAINRDDDAASAWNKTFALLKKTLDFRVAFVMEPSADGFFCSTSTDALMIGARWRRNSLFERVAAGRGAVIPDINRMPEWREACRYPDCSSAILAPIRARGGDGLLMLLAHEHGAYAPPDLLLASHLSLVTSQALTMSRQERLAEAIETSEFQREAAVRANEAKSRFFANMSHELRTPLHGVVTVADLLRRSALDEGQREMVDLIRDSGQTLERLLNDVLDFAKIESESLRLEYAPFDLMKDLQSVLDLFTVRADEKGLTLRFVDERPSFASWYEGDALRIRQVVSNLLSNALKFTSEGGVEASLSAQPEGEAWRLCISVTDTGVGFAPEASDRLFERFEQADNTITRRFGGTGLGLSISRELAKLMEGDIVGHSRPEGGSRFDFTFLARAVAPAPPPEPEVASALSAPPMLKVLLVEDNPNNQRILTMILDMFGATTRLAENGLEACNLVHTEMFDVVLMDLQMPVMDGLTAMRTLRIREKEEALPRVPIIAVSANAMAHQVQEALEAGADAHISKPVDPSKLLAQILALQT